MEAQRDLDMEATRDLRQQLATAELGLQTEHKSNEQLKTQTAKDQEEMTRLRLEINKLGAEKNMALETARVDVAAERNKVDMEKRKMMVEKEQIENEKNALMRELERAKVDLTEMRRLLLEVRDAYSTALRDNTELKEKLDKASLPISTPVNSTKPNPDDKDKDDEVVNLKNQLAGALATVANQQRRLNEIETKTPTTTSTALNDDVAALKTQLANANTDKLHIQSQLDSSKNNVSRLHSLLDDVQSKNTTLEERMKAAEQRTKTAEDALVNSMMANSARNVDIVAMKQKQEESERVITDLKAEVLRLSSESDRIPAQTPSSASIVLELKKEVEVVTNKKKSLEAQARIDFETIKDLRIQVETLRSERGHTEEADRKRVLDLKVVNDTLLKFALDTKFQEDLKRPLVLVALNCWSGTNVNIPGDLHQLTTYRLIS